MATGTAVFSKQETDWHRTARFHFVPWVARLLDRGPLRGRSEPLPPGNPGCLTGETVDAIRDMMNRAVWRFLARDCGWRLRSAVNFTSDGEGAFNKRRLWDSPAGSKLPPLRFTSATIDLLLTVFNGTRGNSRIENLILPGSPESNGDLFLHHLVFRRLAGSARELGVSAEFSWGSWYANPLNALSHVVSIEDPESAAPAWDRLTEPDVSAFFPWIGARIAADWRSRHGDIRENLERWARWHGGLAALARQFIESTAGRPDLSIFLLDFLAFQAESAAGDRERFEAAAETLSRRQREQLAIPWSDFLKVADNFETMRRRAVDLHPIERSGPEKCFLAAWEEMTFADAADSLRDLRHQIRPAIS